MKTNYSMQEIKGSFNPAFAAQPVIYSYFLRPISFYFTYVLIRLRMSAYQANAAGLIIGILAALFFILGGRAFMIWGAVFYLLFIIFDFVDGNMARVADTVNFYGKFLDGAIDTFIENIIPLALTVGYFLATGSKTFLLAGIAVSFLRLYAAYAYTRLSFINRWAEKEVRERGEEFSKKSLNPLKTSIFPVDKINNTTTDIKILAIVTAGFSGFFAIALFVVLAVVALQAIVLTVIPFVDASRSLRIPYISIRDPRAKK